MTTVLVPKAAPVRSPPARTAAPNRNAGDLTGKIEDLTNQVSEYKVGRGARCLYISSTLAWLQLTVEGLEKERDFYFGKLRDIEVMCQESEDENPLIQKILEVLYATEDGFAPPEELEGGAGDEDEYWN